MCSSQDSASQSGHQKDSQNDQFQDVQQPESQGRAGLQDQQQGYQRPLETNTTHHENAHPFDPNLNQHTINRSHHIPSHSNASDPNQVNPLTLLAHALEPYTAQAPSPHTPASAPSGRLEEPAHSINTGTSASSNPARYAVEDDRENGSYGTLMLGKRGRSKYLGPTAGSEWLKEVIFHSV